MISSWVPTRSDTTPKRFVDSKNEKAGLMVSPALIPNATASCFNPGSGKLRSLLSSDFGSLEMSRLRSTLPPPVPAHRDSHSKFTYWTDFMLGERSLSKHARFVKKSFGNLWSGRSFPDHLSHPDTGIPLFGHTCLERSTVGWQPLESEVSSGSSFELRHRANNFIHRISVPCSKCFAERTLPTAGSNIHDFVGRCQRNPIPTHEFILHAAFPNDINRNDINSSGDGVPLLSLPNHPLAGPANDSYRVGIFSGRSRSIG